MTHEHPKNEKYTCKLKKKKSKHVLTLRRTKRSQQTAKKHQVTNKYVQNQHISSKDCCKQRKGNQSEAGQGNFWKLDSRMEIIRQHPTLFSQKGKGLDGPARGMVRMWPAGLTPGSDTLSVYPAHGTCTEQLLAPTGQAARYSWIPTTLRNRNPPCAADFSPGHTSYCTVQ